jgi:hypothetical protein
MHKFAGEKTFSVNNTAMNLVDQTNLWQINFAVHNCALCAKFRLSLNYKKVNVVAPPAGGQ